jgi:hypothetical protein
MGIRLWFILLGTMVSFLVEGVSANGTTAALATKIEAALPKSWSVADRKSGALPEGHYWGQNYSGVRGEEILLQGSADVHVSWQDAKGEWHNDVVGKEALKLYVMPATYRESLLRFFIPKRPVSARLLVETESFKVYAHPSFRIVDSEKLDRIVKQGKAIRWPDSPENTGSLSWGSWSADIPRTLKGA